MTKPEDQKSKSSGTPFRRALPNPSWYTLYYKGRGQSSGFIGIFGFDWDLQPELPLRHYPLVRVKATNFKYIL